MASVPGNAGTRLPVSGGKIVRARRKSGPRTPYDRPRSRNSVRENPNWISRLVYRPTVAIASGAGKLVSYFFFSESSSSSSSDNDTDSDGYTDNEIEDNNASCSEEETWDKTEALEISHGPANDQQTAVQKSETKHVIEKLVTQEWSAREESDKRMNITKPRVVYRPVAAVMEDERQNMFPNSGGNDFNVPDLSSKTASEEKKLEFGAKYKLESKDEAASPTDMAKSYMRTRPPWASPFVDTMEFRSPSPIGMQLYKDSYLSSSKLKRRSPSAGSWNIQEETRKVRAKASEDMIRNLSSSTTDWHAAASSSSPVTRDVQEKGQNEALPNPVAVNLQHNQDAKTGKTSVGARSIPAKTYLKSSKRVVLDEALSSINGLKSSEDTNTASKSGADLDRANGDTPQACSTTKTTAVVLALEATPDPIRKPSASKGVPATEHTTSKEAGNPLARRVFPFSEFSLSPRVDAQPKPRQPHEENNRVVDETENSCSIRQEQLTDDLTLPISVSCGWTGRSRGGGGGRSRGRKQGK